MLPAANRSSGQNVGSPDVCKTPIGTVHVPTPYVNVASHAQAVGASTTTYVCMQSALNQGSTIPQSSGDEAGTDHWSIKGSCTHTRGNSVVFIDSLPAINLTSLTSQNKGNCSSGAVAIAGAATVLLTLDRDGVPATGEAIALPFAAVAELDRALCAPSVLVTREGADAEVQVRLVHDGTALELATLLGCRLADARSLKLDLRGCPGGTLIGAARVAGLFLPASTVVARVRGLDGAFCTLAVGAARAFAMNLTVLVDAETASAGEVLASALSRTRRADVIGGPTRGKRSVQSMRRAGDRVVYATIGEVFNDGW